jgi:hypothetical protein
MNSNSKDLNGPDSCMFMFDEKNCGMLWMGRFIETGLFFKIKDH